MEFVFHTPSRSQARGGQHPRTAVRDDVLRDFRLIHEPPKGSGGRDNPNWQYWKREFEERQPVPVFFLEDVDRTGAPIEGTVAAMGTAFMFKLAQTSSTRQMLAHSDPGHLDGSELDIASLIFGAVDESGQTKALKRRATFGWAEATLPPGQSEPIKSTATVLSNPKPSYFQIYVRQPHREGDRLYLSQDTPPKPSEAYASYTPVVGDRQIERKIPELSGAKIWPAPTDGAPLRSGSKVGLPPPPERATRKVQTELNMLPVGTRFSNVTLHVHNLRKTEVGALLWALTFGHADALDGRQSPLRHRLGGAKPFGLGSIRISLGSLGGLRANSGGAVPSADDFVKDFLETMRLARLHLGETKPWADCVQVRGLRAGAEPSSRPGYMNLEGRGDTYVTARRDGYFLAPYADDGWEFPRGPTSRPGSNGEPSPGPAGRPGSPTAGGEQPPAVKGAKVSVGPSAGEIIAVIGAKFKIRRASGREEILPRDSFVVIASPKTKD